MRFQHCGWPVRVGVSAVIATTLLVAGCGGGDRSDLDNAGGPTSAIASTTASSSQEDGTPFGTSTPASPDETDIAQSLLLRLEHLPTGWVETIESPDEEEGDNPFDECRQTDPEGVTGEAESSEFSRNTATLAHFTRVFASPDAASEHFGFDEERLLCVTELIGEGAVDDEEVEFSDASLGRTSFTSAADEVVAYQIEFTVEVRGETGPFSSVQGYYDIVTFRTDRVLHQVITSDVLTPFPSSELTLIVDGITERAAAALAGE